MLATRVSALAIAAVLGLSLAAQAQTPPPSPTGTAAGRAWGGSGMDNDRSMSEAAHMKALHDALNIRPDQEAAFQAFAASMRPEMARMGDEGSGPGGPGGWRNSATLAPMPLPQRLDIMVQRFDMRTSRMREAMVRHVAAVKAFYDVLNPDQRRTFDALPDLMGHGGMEGMGEHPGMGDMPPHHRMAPGAGMDRQPQ